jgi:oligosaccharide repeat unit polymerase
MFFIILWLFFPLFWFYLLKFAGLNFNKLNLMTFVVNIIILYQYLGLPILYFKFDPLRIDNVSDSYLVFKVFILTSVTITLMILGYIIGRILFGHIKYIRINEIKNSTNNSIISLLILTIICILVLLLYIYKLGFQNIALFAALNVITDNNLGVLRSNMGNSFEGKYHWYYLFMNQILKFCVFVFFSIYLLNPIKKYKYIFFFSLIFLVISLTLATEKGPLINLIIALFLIFIILKNKSIFPIKYILPIVLLITVILCFFYINFMGAKSIQQAMISLYSRTLTGQIEPVYNYLHFFPNVHDYLYGRTMSNPMNIFPFEYYNLSQEIMIWYFPDENLSGIVGSMPTVYWGELYANFGIIGVFIFPTFVGMLLYGINYFLMKFKLTPILIGIYVWFLMYFSNLSSTSLSSFLFDIYPIIIFTIFLFLNFITFKNKNHI